MTHWKNVIKIFYLVLFSVIVLVSLLLYSLEAGNNLEFLFFDVGQGDSFMIRTVSGQNILIDGGPDNTLLYKLGKYLPYFDRRLDLVVLTHPHNDHLVGLIEATRRYQIESVLIPDLGEGTKNAAYEAWQTVLVKNGVKVILAKKINTIIDQDLKIKIFSPPQVCGKNFNSINDNSLVLKVYYKELTVLFMADASSKVENCLMDSGADLSATILKVGHHGSDNSSNKNFLQKVRPELAIISVGDNKFGQPADSVLAKLQELASKVLITEEEGDIVLECGSMGSCEMGQ